MTIEEILIEVFDAKVDKDDVAELSRKLSSAGYKKSNIIATEFAQKLESRFAYDSDNAKITKKQFMEVVGDVLKEYTETTEQKAIKDIVEIMKTAMNTKCVNCAKCEYDKYGDYDCSDYLVAEAIYNAGYRKSIKEYEE